MGAVYEARHVELDRPAAIKALHPQVAASPDLVRRFLDEARAATKIEHPGIVQVFDVGKTDDGTAYIVMELLRGEALSDRLARVGRLDPAEAIRVVCQASDALAAAHRAGIVHRDLKPENLFVIEDSAVVGGERVKVLDFGIAKLVEPGGISHTGTNMLMGTPPYMSPEQCRGGKHVDVRTDVYSLGCILYQLVCGRPPFVYDSAGELIAAHLHETPPAATLYGAPPELEPIIARCLAKDRDARFASMDDLIAALRDPRPRPAPVQPAPELATTAVPPPNPRLAPTVTPGPTPRPTPRPAVAQPRRIWPWVAGFAGVALVATVALVASETAESIAPARPGPVSLEYSLALARHDEARLVIGGEVIDAPWKKIGKRHRLVFTRPANRLLSDSGDSIALRFATPCGDYDVPYRLLEGSLKELRARELEELDPEYTLGVAIFANVSPRQEIKKASVWIDNTGGPARTVAVGELEAAVKAGEIRELTFPTKPRRSAVSAMPSV